MIGRRLGEFVVREPLSSGGFGTVFRAEQPALSREAVIKVLHHKLLGSETVVQRFLLEAKLASRLDHPFAAHTYAFGAEPDGVLWIAMELVRGTPLDKLLEAHGPLSLERFLPLLERICEVVHTAHEQGIVHRDLKPANVMVLSRAGRLLPKLLDLGIAKLDGGTDAPATAAPKVPSTPAAIPTASAFDVTAAGDGVTMPVGPTGPRGTPTTNATTGRLTNVGAAMGSPLYMAPEQWNDAAAVDGRTDIYALGVLAYEALTGRAPFEGATQLDLAAAHAMKPPPSLGPGFPPELDPVIARALAKKPADRFASALELAAAFRAASGIAAEADTLPHLPDEVRARTLASMPQPIAQALAALDAARNAHQARDAMWRLVRVCARLVGVLALAAHSHVRADPRVSDQSLGRGLRALSGRSLSDRDWLEMARDLTRPFAQLRDAHPIPELVELLQGGAPGALDELVALRAAGDEAGGAADEHVRELLERGVALCGRMLGELGFLAHVALAVPVDDTTAEEWMGARREPRAARRLARGGLPPGQPVLLDAAGAPVLSLWPFVQVREAAPGVPEALYFVEGRGRRGARVVALPDAFEHDDEALWDAIGALVGEGADTSDQAREECPFPGLAAYGAADADSFTGRERETAAFLNRLQTAPLLAVVGPSGAGKSSFVQAGVLPGLPASWVSATARPGPAPLVSLSAQLTALGVDVPARDELARHPGALGSALRVFASARGRRAVVVVVVDQLEELFTLCEDPEERVLFADALVRAARSAEDPVRVVFTLRDDFLLRAEALPPLRARLGPALQLLTTPEAADLRRILEEPVARAGYAFDDPALPGEMVDEVRDRPGALALLSFTASKLWELRDRRFRQLGHKAYRSLGGVGGALAQHAEATLTAMHTEEQRLVREVFRHLVTAEGTRAVLSTAEVTDVLGGGDRAAAVLEKLVTSRLLVVSESAGGGERIEVTHEALLDAWPRLVTWRREDVEGARMRDQLRAAVRQWDERGRPSGLLWRGDALAEYRLWRARTPGALTASEEAFAAASLADAARGRRIRRGLLGVTIAALAVAAGVLLVQNARVSRQRASAEHSAGKLHALLLSQYESQGRRLLLDGDPLQALAYLHEAAVLGARGPAHELLVASAVRATDGQLHELRHDDSVLRVAFSPDGARLATAGLGGEARLWNVADGRMEVELHDGVGVTRVVWRPDGGEIATANQAGVVSLWDPTTGARRRELAGSAGIQAILYAPGGERIAVLTMDDAVALWDPATGQRVALLRAPTEGEVPLGEACAFSPDGARLAAGGRDGIVRIWDVATGALREEIRAHAGGVSWVAFSPDGGRLVSATDTNPGGAAVWRLGQREPVVRLAHRDGVRQATFSPDGARVLTASLDRTAVVWDAGTGAVLATLAGHAAGVNRAVFGPAGTTVATASDDATAVLWDVATGRPLARRVDARGVLLDVELDPGGRRMATASMDGGARVYSTEPTVRRVALRGHGDAVLAVDFSASGGQVATGSSDGTARVWDVRTGRELFPLQHGGQLMAVRFDPAGERIATAGDGGTVQLFDVRTGAQIARLAVGGEVVMDVAWAPDGRRLVAARDDGEVRVLDVDDGTTARTLRVGTMAFWAGFDHAAARIGTAGNDDAVHLWDAASGRELARFADREGRISGDFDQRGARMVSVTANRTAKVWDLASGVVLAELVGHMGFVRSAVFGAQDRFVVTSSWDGTARVWDAAQGDLLMILDHPGTQLHDAAFSPDGHQVVTARDDGLAEIWELPRWKGTTEELGRLVRCRVPYRIEGERIVPRPRDPTACTTPR